MAPKKSSGKMGENPHTIVLPRRDHGHNTESGENPHVNYNSATSDRVKAKTGDNAPAVLDRGPYIVGYFTDPECCNVGPEHVHFTMAGDNARTGVGA